MSNKPNKKDAKTSHKKSINPENCKFSKGLENWLWIKLEKSRFVPV